MRKTYIENFGVAKNKIWKLSKGANYREPVNNIMIACRHSSVKLRPQRQLYPRPCFSSPSPRSHNTSNWAASWQNQRNGMCTQRRLRSAVWSESLLYTQWVAKDPSFLHADSEERMPRLVWVFAGRICRFVGFCHEAARICLVYVCHYLNTAKIVIAQRLLRPTWQNELKMH